MAVKKAAAKKVAAPVEKKVEMKYVAVVIEKDCGSMFTKHQHHDVQVLQIPKSMPTNSVREAAEQALELGRKMLGTKGRVTTVQEVSVHSHEYIHERAKEVRSMIEKD